jgi:hypothetical protein
VHRLFLPSWTQIFQNPAKPGQARAKKIKEKSLDWLGLASPDRAFSMSSADPPAEKSFSAPPLPAFNGLAALHCPLYHGF